MTRTCGIRTRPISNDTVVYGYRPQDLTNPNSGGFKMAAKCKSNNKPILYWITLTVMYVAFVAVVLS